MIARRSFLVTLGASFLGRFLLPELSLADESRMVAFSGSTGARWLLTEPIRSGNVFLWCEEDLQTQEVRPMIWFAETQEDLREAERFHAAANWRSWRTLDELQLLLRGQGPWLIRWNYNGKYEFLTTSDEELLFGEGHGDLDILLPGPENGARVTAAQAFRLIRRLSERHDFVFEPVTVDQATSDLRPAMDISADAFAAPTRDPVASPDADFRQQAAIATIRSNPEAMALIERLRKSAVELRESLRNSFGNQDVRRS